MKLISRAKDGDSIFLFPILVEATEFGCSDFYPAEVLSAWHGGRTAHGMKSFITQEPVYTLSDDGEVKAFIHLGPQDILGLFVHPDEQGKGYGKDLMKFAIKEIQERPIRVAATLNAVDFYAKFGFRKVKLDFIRRNEHDIYVWRMELD